MAVISLITASSSLNFMLTEIETMQRIKYMIYRYYLGIKRYVAVAAIRSEVGSSQMITRIKQTRIMFIKGV